MKNFYQKMRSVGNPIYLLLSLGALLFALLPVQGQGLAFTYPSNNNTYYIDTLSGHLPLTEKAMYWVDSTCLVKAEDLHQLKGADIFDDWSEVENIHWNEPYHYWVRVSLFNSLPKEHTWLLNLGKADIAEIWALHEQGLTEERQAGLLCRYDDPRWLGRNGQVVAPLTIPSRKTVTVYAKISSEGALAPQLAAHLQTLDTWDAQSSWEEVLQQVILAFLLLVLAINLPAALWQRQFSHLFFLLFSLAFSAWMLYEYGYFRAGFLWEKPLQNWHLGMVSLIMAQPLFLWFILYQLKPRNPILQLWAIVRTGFAVILSAFIVLDFPIPVEWASRAFWILDAILVTYIGFVGNASVVRNGGMMERWIFGGGLWLYTFLTIGMLTYSLFPANNMGIGHPIGLYFFQVGGVGCFLAYIWATIKYSIHEKIELVFEPWVDELH